jgi:hypothetical protein
MMISSPKSGLRGADGARRWEGSGAQAGTAGAAAPTATTVAKAEVARIAMLESKAEGQREQSAVTSAAEKFAETFTANQSAAGSRREGAAVPEEAACEPQQELTAVQRFRRNMGLPN